MKTKANGKILHARGLEKSVLLTCPYIQHCKSAIRQEKKNFEVHIAQSNLHIQCNTYKNSNTIFHTIRKITQNFHGIPRPWIAKANLRKNKTGSIKVPDSKPCYRTTVTKTVCYQQKKKREREHWNRIQSPEKNYFYSQLTFGKGIKDKQWWKTSLFNKWC